MGIPRTGSSQHTPALQTLAVVPLALPGQGMEGAGVSERLTIRLNGADNVVVARVAIPQGTTVEEEGVTAAANIPPGHKIATAAIAQGGLVRKYGQVIGQATAAIAPGEHVHLHNLGMSAEGRDHAIGSEARPTQMAPRRAAWMGIRRPDGRIATRNYIGVLTTVNCSASVARMIADRFRGDALRRFPNVDGVVALTHGSGCGMASEGQPMDLLRRTIGGYARHPNFFAVVIVALGCEANQLTKLLEAEGLTGDKRVFPLTIQETGGTAATVKEAEKRIRTLLQAADAVDREPVPASELVLALQCGGSDGYSGITANPALGAAADILISQGGTVILSETPEIYGAEHLLTRRAASEEAGSRLLEKISWWEEYTARNGGAMNNNPSPGNKEGGLTTILEKSLGAVAKGGTTNLAAVADYAAPVTAKGLVFMDTPGNDPVSITGQVAGGANIVCFTTGRGSAYGCVPAPSLKLSTNTPLYQRMEGDMDINCGVIADGTASVEEMGEVIFNRILEVASGQKTKSEELGVGSEEFVPWQQGAVM